MKRLIIKNLTIRIVLKD